ncbi:Ctr copper transporter [Aspergillus pseudoustus]|uniref:Copper transport protein n=1 Tax=Aspergillus pseudoustus TaxID=1810923 RepID=A0ABR4KYW1_9EURO
MDMDMDMDISTNHDHGHGHTQSTDHAGADTSMPMTMSSIFTSSTTITLFFSSWTTTSPLTYTLTLLLLFLLSFLNRFLAALRFQLESADARSTEPSASSIPILAPPRSRRRGMGVHIPKARLSPLPVYMRVVESDKDMDCEESIGEEALLQPSSSTLREGEGVGFGSESMKRSTVWARVRRTCSSAIFSSWTPSAPWGLRQDGSRAILEGVRAFIGYILMLAVMTFNVGIFVAVLGGILVGELMLGRYMRHSAWEDGACHD